jgi:serine protease Do
VIGMNTAIASSVGQFSGVGFAIPINVIRSILPVLVKGGSVARGMLGVIIQDINPELAEQFQLTNTQGALVSQVNPDSPAAKAGIEVGDVIIGYDSKPVKNTLALRNLVAATAPGAKARLEVIRDGKEKTITATVGKLTAEKMAAASGQSGQPLSRFGLQIEPLTPDLARQYGLQNETGVVITSVDQAGTAGLAGLQPGDLIKQVDRQNVSSVQDVQAAMDKSARKNNVLLLINRKGTSLFVNLSRP